MKDPVLVLPVLAGILPTLARTDLSLENMVPNPRYLTLNRVMRAAKGDGYDIAIKGLDELVAIGQFLVQDHRRGGKFWRTFFRGGAQPDGACDHHPGFDAPLTAATRSAMRGVGMPWTLLASAALGLWLMFTRLSLGTHPPLADSDHLMGALIVTVAVIAMAEVARALRFVNIIFGLWLIAAPWWIAGSSMLASWLGVLVGLLVIGLSLPRGTRSHDHYGSWDRFV